MTYCPHCGSPVGTEYIVCFRCRKALRPLLYHQSADKKYRWNRESAVASVAMAAMIIKFQIDADASAKMFDGGFALVCFIVALYFYYR